MKRACTAGDLAKICRVFSAEPVGVRQMSSTSRHPAQGLVAERVRAASSSRALFSSSPDCVRRIHARHFSRALSPASQMIERKRTGLIVHVHYDL